MYEIDEMHGMVSQFIYYIFLEGQWKMEMILEDPEDLKFYSLKI